MFLYELLLSQVSPVCTWAAVFSKPKSKINSIPTEFHLLALAIPYLCRDILNPSSAIPPINLGSMLSAFPNKIERMEPKKCPHIQQDVPTTVRDPMPGHGWPTNMMLADRTAQASNAHLMHKNIQANAVKDLVILRAFS